MVGMLQSGMGYGRESADKKCLNQAKIQGLCPHVVLSLGYVAFLCLSD